MSDALKRAHKQWRMRDEMIAFVELMIASNGPKPRARRYGPHPHQMVEVHGAKTAPLLIVVHGGYFRPKVDRGHARPMARALAESGWQVALVEYRRIPGDPDSAIEDLGLLTAHFADRQVAGWIGHSAGGCLVLLRAMMTDLPPTKVVALAPIADLRRDAAGMVNGAVAVWTGGPPDRVPEVYDRVDPTAVLRRHPEAAARIALIHGNEDRTIDVSYSLNFDAPVTILQGAHHFDVIDPESAWWSKVLDVISTHLSESPTT